MVHKLEVEKKFTSRECGESHRTSLEICKAKLQVEVRDRTLARTGPHGRQIFFDRKRQQNSQLNYKTKPPIAKINGIVTKLKIVEILIKEIAGPASPCACSVNNTTIPATGHAVIIIVV